MNYERMNGKTGQPYYPLKEGKEREFPISYWSNWVAKWLGQQTSKQENFDSMAKLLRDS